MKFEIDIPESVIQERLNRLIDVSSTGRIFDLRNIIDRAVNEAILRKLESEAKVKIIDAVDVHLQEEIEKACTKKIPGWIQRRVKEYLEKLRISNKKEG